MASLRENGTHPYPESIRFHSEGNLEIGKRENWSLRQSLLQPAKCSLSFSGPLEGFDRGDSHQRCRDGSIPPYEASVKSRKSKKTP